MSVTLHGFSCYCLGTLQVPCLNFKKKIIIRGFPTRLVYLYYIACLRYTILVGNPRNVPLSDSTVRKGHFFTIYYHWEKMVLPDISYYLSQGRCFIHICIATKELTTWSASAYCICCWVIRQRYFLPPLWARQDRQTDRHANRHTDRGPTDRKTHSQSRTQTYFS